MRLFAIATVEPNNDGKVIVNTCFDCTEYSRLLLTAMSVVARVDFTIALAGKYSDRLHPNFHRQSGLR